MSDSYDFADVERFTVGTVGPAGRRVFLIQATSQGQTVTLKVEKQQIAALAQYLQGALEELPRPGHLPDDMELLPGEPLWAVGAMGLTYDEETDRVLLVCDEAVMGEEQFEDEAGSARFHLTREQVASVAIQGTRLVESGRPPCPLCGYPLDDTHACPRTNGHRSPAL